MLKLLPEWLKAGVAAVGGAIVAAGVYSLANTVWLLPSAREQGKNDYIAEKAVQDLKAEAERKGDDAKLQRMSDYDLCVVALGRVPGCDVFLQPVR